MALCFVALFIQLNNIQVIKANSLANSPDNPRVQQVERSQTRGSILSADGVTLASSVLAPKRSIYKYQRVYDPYTATLFAQIIGFDSIKYGNFRGVEAQYNSYLTPHTRPAKTLRDLLVNRTVVDNVSLTVGTQLQTQVAAALDQHAPGRPGRRRGGAQPGNRCGGGHVLQPDLRSQSPGVAGPGHGDGGLERQCVPAPGGPGGMRPREPAGPRHLRAGLPPGVDVQGRDHVGRAREPPGSGQDDLSERPVGHPAQLGHPGPGPDQLPRRGLPAQRWWQSRDAAHPVL